MEYKNIRIMTRKLYVYPVPTAQELNQILDYFPDGSAYKLGILLIAVLGMRPKELTELRYSDIDIDKENRPFQVRHKVYKAKNGTFDKSLHYNRKEVLKPIWSEFLKDQIIEYMRIHPVYEHNKIFPWNTSDSLHKAFSQLRNKVIKKQLKEYDFILDKVTETEIIKGQKFNIYRISPYSLRRFSFTYHYYITYNKDVITLSKNFGHSRPDTTLQYYVMPKESVGLTEEMINNKINIDQFILLKGKSQMVIPDFTIDDVKKRMRGFGQVNLFNWINPC
jgi:integrase